MEWIQNNETLAWWLFVISVTSFLVTLIAVPVTLIRLSADYFIPDYQSRLSSVSKVSHPVIRTLWELTKFVLGLTLVVVGILMLVLPGQGIITILIGIMLLRFPGKYRLQRWILGRERVLRSANWLRRKAGREPLRI
jgi:hypothetical protein